MQPFTAANKLNEIKRQISETENESLKICNELESLCGKSLLEAESYCKYILEALDQVKDIEKSYNKVYKDLFDAHKILNTIYLCPCLPQSVLHFIAPDDVDDKKMDEVIDERKRGMMPD